MLRPGLVRYRPFLPNAEFGISYLQLPPLVCLFVALLLASCNLTDGFSTTSVDVHIPVEDVKPVLILDGKIERDSTARIRISRSLDIDEDPAAGEFPVVENASVSISANDGQGENLVYKGEGLYIGNTVQGKEDITYTMVVRIGGDRYTATSTMFPEPGFDSATTNYSTSGDDGKKGFSGKTGPYYSEMWWVTDNPNRQNFYFFTWHVNGVRIYEKDWAIDDNRIVHDRGYIRVFNPTIDPLPNQFLCFTASLIDKPTYNFYNMYEKIMRNLIGTGSVTPYNPVSNFGKGTMGNFRAVSFSRAYFSTPPELSVRPNNGEIKLSWPENSAFVNYYLFNSANDAVDTASELITEQKETGFIHNNLENGKDYYYRIMVKDSLGQLSPLSGLARGTPVDSLFSPDELTAAVTGSGIQLKWERTPGAVKYHVYWSKKSDIHKDSSYVRKIEDVSDIAYLFIIPQKSEKAQAYYFRVAAENAHNVISDLSNLASNVEQGQSENNAEPLWNKTGK